MVYLSLYFPKSIFREKALLPHILNQDRKALSHKTALSFYKNLLL